MTSKTFYRDVEFNLEVEYKIKANSDVVNFDHTKTETQKLKISGENIEKAKNEFSYAVGYELTTEQMLQVVFSDLNTIQDLVSGCTDSVAKDLFSDAFARFVLNDGRKWPRYGSQAEYKKSFFEDVEAAALNMGFVRSPD